MTRGLFACTALLLATSACADNGEQSPKTDGSSPSATATVTVTASQEPTTAKCEVPGTTRLLAATWELVVASKGASDHSRYVLEFADEVSELNEDLEDNCEATQVMVAAAQLNFEASLLAFPHELTPPGADSEPAQYAKAASSGNTLFQAAGSDDAKFIPLSCTGKVQETPECSGLQ